MFRWGSHSKAPLPFSAACVLRCALWRGGVGLSSSCATSRRLGGIDVVCRSLMYNGLHKLCLLQGSDRASADLGNRATRSLLLWHTLRCEYLITTFNCLARSRPIARV